MKKLIIGLMCAGLLITITPLETRAAAFEEPYSLMVSKLPTVSVADGRNLLVKSREENKSIEKSRSHSDAKNEKRVEGRNNRHYAHSSGGVYISGGGILLLVLLLIIIF